MEQGGRHQERRFHEVKAMDHGYGRRWRPATLPRRCGAGYSDLGEPPDRTVLDLEARDPGRYRDPRSLWR